MLKIEAFIRSNPDWFNLLAAAPYNLKISFDGDYVLFKYNQISSDFNEPICREARGLIIHIPTMRVVRMAFSKFFNLGESYADTIDWSTATSSEKIDGSIMSVWYHDGWHVSTNGTINSYNAELSTASTYHNFGELFAAAAANVGLNIEELDPNYCYTFELVSPFNKVVLTYPETTLYHLSTRDMRNLEEVEMDIGVPKPQVYNLNSEAEYRAFVSSMPEGHEGIVVRDAAGHRVKIKTLLYFELHRQHNNGAITLERIVELIRANDHAEYLAYFPEQKPLFDSVQSKISTALAAAQSIPIEVEEWKSVHAGAPRKWFAQDFGKNKYASLYFAAYDNKFDAAVSNLDTKHFIKLFKIEL